MEGRYKINAPHLRALQQEASALCRFFPGGVTLTHILREGNARADQLANQGARLAAYPDHDIYFGKGYSRMICPYCNLKNASNATVCNQCGIILRLGRTSRLVPPASSGGGGLAFMRGLLPGNRLKGQQAALQTRIEELVKRD